MWEHDPDTVSSLVDGLTHRSDSLLRASLLREAPKVDAPPIDLTLDWYGMGQDTVVLAQLYNLIAAVKGVSARIHGPSRHRSVPVDPIQTFWDVMTPGSTS